MNRSVAISVLLAITATLWILSGSLSSDENQESQVSDTKEKALFKVQVQPISAEKVTDIIELQGEIKALKSVLIRAETMGTVEQQFSFKGDRVRAGQALIQITMNDREARLEQAKAQLKVQEAELASGLKLKQKKLISQNQHKQNIANVEAARAAVKQIEVEIQHTRINAAFEGILDEVQAEAGDYLSIGDPIATLIDDSTVRIVADLPQQYVQRVKKGHRLEAQLIDGTRVSGPITYIARAANPSTRTYKIEAEIENQDQLKYFGQSARVKVLLEERLAHKLKPSYLDLDVDGSLRVKSIDTQNRVQTHSVDIIRNEADGVWLSGMPDQLTLITVGQGFVSAGDIVEPVLMDNAHRRKSDSDANTEAAL